MAQTQTTPQISRRTRWSWYFYDFGNSAYAAVVLLAVYSAYFKNVVVGGAEGTRLWGVSVGIAAILVAIVSPVLGSIADFSKAKKKFLYIFTILSVVFTACLFFVLKGDVFLGMLFFILAEIGYRGAQVFYDALLVDVSTPESIGSVSGNGWAIGSAGGVVALVLVLIPIKLIGGTDIIRISFLIAAVFYALSSIPTFLWVRQVAEPEKLPAGESNLSHAFKNLASTFRDVRNYKEFIKFMIAFLIYNDGIMMTLDYAAIIGGTLFGVQTTQLIVFVIIVQITSVAGAYLFGILSDKKSCKYALILSLIAMIFTVSALFVIKSIILFYIVGALAGFFLSGVQAVSRTFVSQLAPSAKTTEFYGFLTVAGRTSTFIGPLVFGTLSYRMNNYYVNHGVAAVPAEQMGMLWAIGSIVVFMVVGLVLLLWVKDDKKHIVSVK
jgi:MFS transporter, UMF1 family